MENSRASLENNMVIPQSVKYRVNNITQKLYSLVYIQKKLKCISTQKLYTNVHIIIYNSPKAETTQM